MFWSAAGDLGRLVRTSWGLHTQGWSSKRLYSKTDQLDRLIKTGLTHAVNYRITLMDVTALLDDL